MSEVLWLRLPCPLLLLLASFPEKYPAMLYQGPLGRGRGRGQGRGRGRGTGPERPE